MKKSQGRPSAVLKTAASRVQRPPEVLITTLTRLNEAGARLWRTQDLHAGLEEILSAAIELLRADFGYIQIYEPGDHILRIAAQQGFKKPFLDHFREVTAGDYSSCGHALRRGERVIIEDVKVDAGFSPHRRIARLAGFRAVQSTPLNSHDGRPLGMISTHFRQPHRPEPMELESLDLYLRQAADFIHRCGLEQLLRRGEERHRKLAEAACAVTWSCPPSGLHAQPQPSWMAFTGQSAEEMLGSGWMRAVHREDRHITAKRWQAAVSRCRPFACELRIRRHDGEWRLMSASATPIRDAQGRIIEWFGINLDVTETRKAQNEVRDREAKLELATNAAGMGLWEWDLRSKSVYFSKEWKRQIGYRDEEIPNRFEEWQNRLHPDDVKPCLQRVRAYLKNPSRPHEMEFRFRHKSGHYLWIYTRADVVKDANGKPVRMLGCHMEITQRKKAVALLMAAQERFRAIYEHGPVGIVMVDLAGRVSLANLSFHQMLGYEDGALVGRNFREFTVEDDQGAEDLLAAGLLSGKQSHYSIEKRYIRKDGRHLWGSLATVLLRDPEGKPVARLKMITDITARKDYEAALRQSEGRYRQLIHSLPVAVHTCDAQGRIVLYNAAAVSLWGREPGPRHRWDAASRILDGEGKPVPRSHSAIAQAVREGEPVRGVERIIERPDGSRSSVLCFPDPILNEAQQVVGGVSVLVDVSEQHRAVKNLRNREERLRAILNTVVDAIITIDRRGTIVGVNPATLRMFGYGEAEMLGRNVSMLMPAPYHEEHDSYLERYCRTREARVIGKGREALARRKDGSVFPVDLAVSEVDHLQFFTGVIRDITERRRLEREILDISEKERAAIGHDLHDDLGQQLAGIWLMCDAMHASLLAEGSAEEKNAAKITQLLKKALTLTRALSRGLHPVVVPEGGLTAALQELAARTRDTFRKKCQFRCIGHVELDTATATHLYRIAQEAVTNAVKHTDTKVIEIELTAGDGNITLAVKDRGRPKSKGRGAAGLNSGSPGVGLRIMRYRADMIRGALEIRRNASGIGTTFLCNVQAHHPHSTTDHPHG